MILISSILFVFSLAVNAQAVNKDNVIDYVESIEVTENNDTWTAYWVGFTDYGYGTIWYHKDGGSKKWCNFDSWLATCYYTKSEVIYELY